MTDRAVPNLPSRSLRCDGRFYGGFGFEVSYRDGGWLILGRGTVVLEFFLAPEHDPYSSWFMTSIRVHDLEELFAALRRAERPKAAPAGRGSLPIALQEWGQRAGYLIDIDGTQLHLIEDGGSEPR